MRQKFAGFFLMDIGRFCVGMLYQHRHLRRDVLRVKAQSAGVVIRTEHNRIPHKRTGVRIHEFQRMQVYFIYNDDYFAHTLTKDLETTSSPRDNDERSIFFVRGVIETVRKLRWDPNIIHCNGWITALAPLYIRQNYNDDPSFRDAKIVYGLYDDDFEIPLDKRLYDKLQMDGIPHEACKGIKGHRVRPLALTRLALAHSDAVIQCSPTVDEEVLKLVKRSKLPFLPYQEGEAFVQACHDFYQSL